MSGAGSVSGPELTAGVELKEVPDGGVLLGHVGEEAVLLFREGEVVTAVGATCTHYSGPLAEGAVAEGKVICPWHHACFSLRTGEALRAPALNPLPRWSVVREAGRVRVTEKLATELYRERTPAPAGSPGRIVVVGFGAAGAAAVEWLLRQGWGGRIDVVEPDPDAPYDRPNLSKDYLAGSAPEEWIPLRPAGWYEEHGVVVHRTAARALDPARRTVALASGGELPYDALLLATGATPVRLPLGSAGPDAAADTVPPVLYLRSLADSRAIIQAAEQSSRAVVLGASFIGLEVAASLRARGLEVAVVAPEAVPFERVLGRELGEAIRRIHEEHGVRFHLGRTASRLGAGTVVLDDGRSLRADMVVVGVGVRPVLDLAEAAGLALDRGLVVDERLRTSAPGIWAAGDIARYPDPETGDRIRIEHWAVAERQGAAAAADMIGQGVAFRAIPFFWSQHYDVPVNYVGHAEGWDEAAVDGSPDARDCAVAYRKAGHTLAVATIYRDRESIAAQQALEAEVAQ